MVIQQRTRVKTTGVIQVYDFLNPLTVKTFDGFCLIKRKREKKMKKTFILTSLVAITMSCPAIAATDVTFGGKYNGDMNIADGVANTTYNYVKSDGTTASDIAYNSDPSLTDFTYRDVDGTTKTLQDGTPDISAYTGTSTASGDVVSTQKVAAGETAIRDNYTYVNGAGETVVLGDTAKDMVATRTLSDYAGGTEVTITNGTTDTTFDGSMYSFEYEGQTLKLSADGTQYTLNGIPQEEPTSGSLFELLTDVRDAYSADKAAVDTAIADTLANWTTEQTNFAAAETVFNDDSAKIAELDGYFATVGEATNALEAAKANQQAAADAFVANGTLYQAAKDVYDAPILETITNGANNAIDNALAEGGAIRSELDQKVSITDAEAVFAEKQQWVDNTLGIESANSNAVADALTGNITGNETTFSGAINTLDNAVSKNTSDIATNATNIAANKTAIENEVARAEAAEAKLDNKIALNTTAIEEEVANRIAGDDMTLSAAKAYADAKNSMSLKSAYNYTDSKVNALEEELSAGIASAAAMSSVAVSNVAKGEVSVGGGYGYYNSQSAVALGAAMGLTDNWSVNAAAGLADSNVTFRAGTNYKFKLF